VISDRRLRRTLPAMLLAALVWVAASVAPASALTPAEEMAVAEVETYLESVKTLSALFVQRAENGQVAPGRMLMRRPGYIRFQYAPPAKILLVSDGSLVSFIDYEVGQLTQWPLFDTPLSYLVRDDLNFGEETLIDEVEARDGVIRFRLRDRDNPEQGSIRLHFTTGPLALVGWQLTDSQEQQTTVALTDLSVNQPLADNAFDFEQPKAPWETDR